VAGTVPHRTETDARRISQAIRELFEGRSNAVGTLTLTAGATSTVVTHANCGPDSRILLMPTTANAAAALATTYVGTVTNGSFTVTHANAVSVDRTFKYAIQG
jgi:hypothetical protein